VSDNNGRAPVLVLASTTSGLIVGVAEADVPTVVRAPVLLQAIAMPVSLGPPPRLASTIVLTRLPVPCVHVAAEVILWSGSAVDASDLAQAWSRATGGSRVELPS
jgi:hypothetical protein